MRAVDIFIAYSHNDLYHKDELKKFLRPLLNTGQARLWDDHEIEGGQDWEAEIKKRLYGADIILLLVSPDSLASEYFYGREVKVSLERHDKGEAAVVPVILRPCAWTITPLKRLEALPEKGRPITSWTSQDEAYTDVAHKIGNIVESRQEAFAATTRQEDRRRDFEAAAQAAEHLFAKKQWGEAQKAFASALELQQPGFSPDRSTLENRMAACTTGIQQVAADAAFETKRKEYETVLASADDATDRKKLVKILQQAMQLYQPGFPGGIAELQQRLHTAQASRPSATEQDHPAGAATGVNIRFVVLAVFAIVLLILGTYYLTQPDRSGGKQDSKEPTIIRPEEPITVYPDWKSNTTISSLSEWLKNNPQASQQDRANATQHLNAIRTQRGKDMKDALYAFKNKDYEEAEKIIGLILQISPRDEEALALKGRIPKY